MGAVPPVLLTPIHHLRTSEDVIIHFCTAAVAAFKSSPPYQLATGIGAVLSDPKYDGKVVRTSAQAVVKVKRSLSIDEVANRTYARCHASGPLRVPQVYRYFADDAGFQYLVMEYLPSQSLADLDWSTLALNKQQRLIRQVTAALAHLRTIPMPVLPRPRPGPVGGGKARGYLSDDKAVNEPVTARSHLERWINVRLGYRSIFLPKNHSIGETRRSDFGNAPLVLCRTDLARRNILVQPDGQLCLLGYHPPAFESYTLNERRERGPQYFGRLLEELNPSTKKQEQREWLLLA
ncbi:MAG: hypothetical protein M1838_000393 [Thelocarpon superellum]|nr:MAG: hypothetical protein M1838_000393 [Thelocarpon superellum]